MLLRTFKKILFLLCCNFSSIVCFANLEKIVERRAFTSNFLEKSLSRPLPFEDCGSKYDIKYLNISGCTSLPCKMNRGSMVLVQTIVDDGGHEIMFLKHCVRWIFKSVKTAASIRPDLCDGTEKCTSKESYGKSYWATVYVNNSLPTIRGTLQWEAVDEYKTKIVCFKVPVTIGY